MRAFLAVESIWIRPNPCCGFGIFPGLHHGGGVVGLQIQFDWSQPFGMIGLQFMVNVCLMHIFIESIELALLSKWSILNF